MPSLLRRLSMRLHFLGAVAGLVLAINNPVAAAECKLQQLAELPVTLVNGRPTIVAQVNGKEGRFLIRSGLTFAGLSPAFAEKTGLRLKSDGYEIVENGKKTSVPNTLVKEFGLAGSTLRNVDFHVFNAAQGFDGWIGEDLLGGLDIEYDFANGLLRFIKPQGCGADSGFAYWAETGASVLPLRRSENDFSCDLAAASINGHPIRVHFDSGVVRSFVSIKAAAEAGVTPQTPGAVTTSRLIVGNPKPINYWILPFDSFAIGAEDIKHTRLLVGPDLLPEEGMILGTDFFLSHRIYVSNSQHKIYFTYSGGPVFRLDGSASPATAKASDTDAPTNSNAPMDADGLIRRAAASSARGNYAAAVDDLSAAIAMEPANEKAFVQRSFNRRALKQTDLAIADMNEALKLDPTDRIALLGRGILYVQKRDKERAVPDLEEAAKLYPATESTHVVIADQYFDLALYEQAIAQYDEWVATRPKDTNLAAVLKNRCRARVLAKGDLDKALADCNSAVKLLPGGFTILYARGMVHEMRGEDDAALADFDAVVRLKPELALGLYARGVAKKKKGLTDAGEVDIQAALKITPDIAQHYGEP